jgi:hypothetical protein
MDRKIDNQTRRFFLKKAALLAAGLSAAGLPATARSAASPSGAEPSRPAESGAPARPAAALPWYRRTLRWGQTNITEIDPARYDIAWWRKHWKRTRTQGVIINAGGGRIAFLPADLDRRFARDNLPDHGDLLANLVRWAARDEMPLAVEGAGLIDCHLYQQPGRLILHVVNLTSAGTWRQPVHELIAVGPLQVRVKLPADVRGDRVRLLVAGTTVPATASAAAGAPPGAGWSRFEIKSVLDHEVAVIE